MTVHKHERLCENWQRGTPGSQLCCVLVWAEGNAGQSTRLCASLPQVLKIREHLVDPDVIL